MILEIILALSIVLNAFLIFYSIRIARKLFVVGTNMEALSGAFVSFRNHVENVHEAEMFYGDQTLQSLIQHSKDVLTLLDEHEDLMAMVSEEEGEEEQYAEEED